MAEIEPPDGDTELEPGMPRWAKVGAIAAIVILLVLVVGKAAGFEHGPQQHAADDTKSAITSSGAALPVSRQG